MDLDDPMVGARVRLVHTSDEWTRLEPGTVGTVRFVDDLGTLHVTWDDGHSLGLVPGEDAWEVLA
jgi:Domain of unknown function (DUF4314)